MSYTRITNNDGITSLNINLKEGKYTITSVFNENDEYKKSNTLTKTITINKKATTLKGSDITKYDCETKVYAAQLLDNQNKILKNKKIIINVNGVDYIRNTDNNGKVSLNINLKIIKTYTITTKFSGDDYYKSSILKNSLTIKKYADVIVPTLSAESGYYNLTNLIINISSKNPKATVYYSLNNGATWHNQTKQISLNLTNGNWTVKSFTKENGINSTIISKNYIIDNNAPIVFANKGSGIYTNSLKVKLTAIDNIDNKPIIYYSLNNNSVNKKYSKNIIISNSNKINILRFYSIDKYGHKSDIITINYFFNVNVANLNIGKYYSNINNAINDKNTKNGDIIEIKKFSQKNQININKQITIISDSSSIYNKIIINTPNVKIYNLTVSYTGSDNAIDIFAQNCTLKNCNIYSTKASSCINIKADNIHLYSNYLKNDKGYGFNLNSNNNILRDNTFNSINGSILFKSNNNYLSNNTFIFRDYSSKLKLINSLNNDICNNNLTVGIDLLNSGNNVFHSNWIYKKPQTENKTLDDYYIININCPNYFNNFYLNFILFDYYGKSKTHNVNVASNSRTDLSDNWWGDHGSLSSITYKNFKDITFNSFITLNVYANSYNVKNGVISGVNLTADLTHNSKGNDMSNKGYLPDGIPIKFKSQNSENISYLSKGLAYSHFHVKNDMAKFDINSNYMSKSLKINRTPYAKINVESTALDEKGLPLKFNYNLNLEDSVNWISVISRNINNYTDELDLIIDGKIVKKITIINSFYNKYKSTYSTKVFNAIHMYNDFIYNNISNIKAKTYVYNAITQNNYDLNSLMKIKENYFFSNSEFSFICSSINISWENILLNLIIDYYKLNNKEKNFVKNHHGDFYDTIKVSINYPGDSIQKYDVFNGDKYFNIPILGNAINRNFKVNYINGAYMHVDNNIANNPDTDIITRKGDYITYKQKNIEGHYVNSKYDAFLTFTFVNTKLNKDILSFYLNEKNKVSSKGGLIYSEGFMKASYGSFLNGLLTLYCVDLTADIGAELFDVTWIRNSPIAVSVCDDHTKTILSGECGFRFGMDVQGDENNVRAFNFLISSSFSQIEYWVMNALFPGISVEGSVTYGLGKLLLNNTSLEVILEDSFAVIREVNSNKRLLVIDLASGRVMDIFNNSIQGAYCYSNQQTEWAYEFGYTLLNSTGIFETLVNYFNKANDTFYHLQDILNGAFESIDSFLDDIDNNVLGIVGSMVISIGIGALLVSNPAGWVILGGIGLVSLGGLLTYYADDLNKGFTFKKSINFIGDIIISIIPFYGFDLKIAKVLIMHEFDHYITKKAITSLTFDKTYKYMVTYGIENIELIRYGTIESIIVSSLGDGILDIYVKTFYGFVQSNIFHKFIDFLFGIMGYDNGFY